MEHQDRLRWLTARIGHIIKITNRDGWEVGILQRVSVTRETEPYTYILLAGCDGSDEYSPSRLAAQIFEDLGKP